MVRRSANLPPERKSPAARFPGIVTYAPQRKPLRGRFVAGLILLGRLVREIGDSGLSRRFPGAAPDAMLQLLASSAVGVTLLQLTSGLLLTTVLAWGPVAALTSWLAYWWYGGDGRTVVVGAVGALLALIIVRGPAIVAKAIALDGETPPPPLPRSFTLREAGPHLSPLSRCAGDPGFAPLPRVARLAASGVHRLHVMVAAASALALGWCMSTWASQSHAIALTGRCGDEVTLLSQTRRWLQWGGSLVGGEGAAPASAEAGQSSVVELQLMALLRVDAYPLASPGGPVAASNFEAAACWHLPGVFMHAATLLVAVMGLWRWYGGGQGAILHVPEGWMWTRDATGAAAGALGPARLLSHLSGSVFAALVDGVRSAVVIVPASALLVELAGGTARLVVSAMARAWPPPPDVATMTAWAPTSLQMAAAAAVALAGWLFRVAVAFPLALVRWACPPTLLLADVSLAGDAQPSLLLFASWLVLLAGAAVAAAPLAAGTAASVAWMGQVESLVLAAVLTRRGVTANDVLAGVPLSPLSSWLLPAAGSRPDAAVTTWVARSRPVPTLPPAVTVDSLDVRVALLGVSPARSLTRYMVSFPPPTRRASGGVAAGVVATLTGVPTVLYHPPPWVTLRRYRMAQLRGLGAFGTDGPPAFDPTAWEVPTAWTRTSKWLAATTRAVSTAAVAAGGYTINRTSLAGVDTRRGFSTTGAMQAASTTADGAPAPPSLLSLPARLVGGSVEAARVIAATLRGAVVPDGESGAEALRLKYGEADSGPEGFGGAIPFLEPTPTATEAYRKAVAALPRVAVGPLVSGSKLGGGSGGVGGLSAAQVEVMTAWRARLMCGEYAVACGDAFAVAAPDDFAGPSLSDLWATLAAAWGSVPQSLAEAQLVLRAVGWNRATKADGEEEEEEEGEPDGGARAALTAAEMACAPTPPAFLRLLRDAVLAPSANAAPAAAHVHPLPLSALLLQHAAAALGPRAASMVLGGGGVPTVPVHTAADYVTADTTTDGRVLTVGGGDGGRVPATSRVALTRHGLAAAGSMIVAAVSGRPSPTRQLLPGRPDSTVALRLPATAAITRTLCGLRAALQELSLTTASLQLTAAAANAGRHASAVVSFVSPDAVGVGGGGGDRAGASTPSASTPSMHAYALSATPPGHGGTLTSGEVGRILGDRTGETWRKVWWAATGIVDATTIAVATAAAAYVVPPVHSAQEAAAEASRKAADAAADAAVKAAAAAQKAGAAPERASLFATPRLPPQVAPTQPLWVTNARLAGTVAASLLSPFVAAVGNVFTVLWDWPAEWAWARWGEHYLTHWSDFADRTWAAWHRQVVPLDPVREGVVFASREQGDKVLRATLSLPALPTQPAFDPDSVGDAVAAAGKAARAINMPGVWELVGAQAPASTLAAAPTLAALAVTVAHPASAAACTPRLTAQPPRTPAVESGEHGVNGEAAVAAAATLSRTHSVARRRSGGNLVSPLASTAWRSNADGAGGADSGPASSGNAFSAASTRSLHRAYVPPAVSRRAMLLAVAFVALPLAWVCWNYAGARLVTWPDLTPTPPQPLTPAEYNDAVLRYRYEAHQWRYRYGPGTKHRNPPPEPSPPPSPDAPPPQATGVAGLLVAAGRWALWAATPIRALCNWMGVPWDDAGVGAVPSQPGWQVVLVACSAVVTYALLAAAGATTYTVHLVEADHVAAVLEVVKVLLDAGRAADAGARLTLHPPSDASYAHRTALLAMQAVTAAVRVLVYAVASLALLCFIAVSHAVAVAVTAAANAVGLSSLPAALVMAPRALSWCAAVAWDGALLLGRTTWWAVRTAASYVRETCCCCCHRRGEDEFPAEENPNPYNLFSPHSASLHLTARSPAAQTAALLHDHRAVLAALDMMATVLAAAATRDSAGVTSASLPAVIASVSALAVSLAQYAHSPRYCAAPAYITTIGGTIRDVFPPAAAWGDAAGVLCASALLGCSGAGDGAAADTSAAAVSSSSIAVVGHMGIPGGGGGSSSSGGETSAEDAGYPLPPHVRPAVATLLMGAWQGGPFAGVRMLPPPHPSILLVQAACRPCARCVAHTALLHMMPSPPSCRPPS